MPDKRKFPLVIVGLFACDLALTLAYVINALMGRPRQGLSQLLDLTGEANLPSWYSSMKMLCAGLMVGAFARHRVKRRERGSWLLVVLAAILIAMSCDEVAQFHERLGAHSDALLPGGSRENTVFRHTGIWMIVFGVPFAIVLWAVLRGSKGFFGVAPGSLGKLGFGFAVFLLGSLGADALGNAFIENSPAFDASVALEETLEAMGITLVFWAGLDLAAVVGLVGAEGVGPMTDVAEHK